MEGNQCGGGEEEVTNCPRMTNVCIIVLIICWLAIVKGDLKDKVYIFKIYVPKNHLNIVVYLKSHNLVKSFSVQSEQLYVLPTFNFYIIRSVTTSF